MKATETNILKFIAGLDKTFIIPPFQRNYSWGETECKELFEDVVLAYKVGNTASDPKKHYLGNIVYYKGENDGAIYDEIVLVDGQQRVTTMLLMICAIRDSIDDTAKKESIDKRYLYNETTDEFYKVRLRQTEYDSEGFLKVVNQDRREIDENTNVWKNYLLLKKLLLESCIDPEKLLNYLTNIEIVDIDLKISNLEEVQTVFEKINATGKPLTASDKIRNWVLLHKSSREQKRLYENYWLQIENLLTSDNVTRFARDFLIMKLKNDIIEGNAYGEFKAYLVDFCNNNREDLLREMLRYAKYYRWILFKDAPNPELRRILNMLDYLKTDDAKPLYMYLLELLYTDNLPELIKILNLFTDFMLRYRIVKPSGGGGALRSVIQSLIEKTDAGEIEPKHEVFLRELSNSANASQRFPDDDEFKSCLLQNSKLNHSYGRLLLVRMEEHKYNMRTTVPFDEGTVEHLMPQTLTDEWKKNLGGSEIAESIYDKYLNSIGNLALVSGRYNSSLSNNEWAKKRVALADVEFNLTKNVAQSNVWNENTISNRAGELAELAIKSTISPLARSTSYQTVENDDEYTPGTFTLSEDNVVTNGAKIKDLLYDGASLKCAKWNDLLPKICKILYEQNPDEFEVIVTKNRVHKATKTKNAPNYDPILTKNPSYVGSPKKLFDTDIYYESCLSSTRAVFYARQLAELFNLSEKFTYTIA
jgi:uncharacterized protein with ParB-like and HNH nuclease domain